MQILVLDIAASEGGAMSVLKNFYNYVREHGGEHNWTFFLSDRHVEETENIRVRCFPEVKASHLRKLLFDFGYGRELVRAENPDVVLSLQNTVVWGVKVPQVDYIHQALPFQREKKFSFLKREERDIAVRQHLIGAVIKQSARRAERVVVQTEWMKDAVCASVGKDRELVTVIYPPYEREGGGMSQDWSSTEFFYPTGDYIYKNVGCIVQARALLPEGLREKCRVEVTLPAGQHEELDCIGSISHGAVLKKLGGGTLIFPSHIETVGLPLIEARAMKTMILAADCPYAREILEGYENVVFFDPFRPEQLAERMKEVMTGALQRKEPDRTGVRPRCMCGTWRELLELLEEAAPG